MAHAPTVKGAELSFGCGTFPLHTRLPKLRPTRTPCSSALRAPSSASGLRAPGPLQRCHHLLLLHEQEEAGRLPNRGGSRAGLAQRQEGWGVPAQPEVQEGSHSLAQLRASSWPARLGSVSPRWEHPAGWHAQQVSQCPVPADSPTGSSRGPGSVPTQATENFAPFRPQARLAESFLCVTPGVEEVPKVLPSRLPMTGKAHDGGGGPRTQGRTQTCSLHPQCTWRGAGGPRRSTMVCPVGALRAWRGRGRIVWHQGHM